MADQAEQTAYQYFVSFQLSKDDREYKWNPTVVEKTLPIDKGNEEVRHTLHLSQVILDDAAEDGELNAVEVQTKSFDGLPVVTPLAFLKAGTIYQTIVNVELPNSSVTFNLKRGSGPIHVIGLHTVTLSAPEECEDDEEGDEEAEGEGVEDEETETEEVNANTEMETDDAPAAPAPEVDGAPEVPKERANSVAAAEVATNGDATLAPDAVNDKKRKISEGVVASEDGEKAQQNGTATSGEEDGAAAKKVKLVTDGEEKPAEAEMEAEAAVA